MLYTHRSTVLHALSSLSASCLSFAPEDVVCPIVSMYRVNAWGVPFSAPMAGCKLVLPGRRLDGESLADLFDAEGVTVALGVPTVFHQLLDYLDRTGRRLHSLRRVGIGGAALSAAQVDRLARIGVEAIQLWGMTETSPLGTSSRPTPADRRDATTGETEIRAAQGRFLFGIDGAVLDDVGKPEPRDRKSIGELAVRGHWVTKGCYRQKAAGSADDWFRTGDLATTDANDVMWLVDRRKDVLKSGGEWISSVDLENAATAHPDVALAAAIGVAHAKWDERPLLIVVPRPGMAPTAEDLRSFLAKSSPTGCSRTRSSSWTRCLRRPPARSRNLSSATGSRRISARPPDPSAVRIPAERGVRTDQRSGFRRNRWNVACAASLARSAAKSARARSSQILLCAAPSE